MPLDPLLASLVKQLPAPATEIDDPEQFRTAKRQLFDRLSGQYMEPGPAVAEVRLVRLPVKGGEIALRMYRPGGPGLHPIHLYLHGGAWISGSIFEISTDVCCRERAAGAGQVVVAVNYRKAPENRFPTGLEDCYAALLWAAEHAAQIGGRADSISIGGVSAGANLAAALSAKVRDQGGPHIRLQILEVPVTDLVREFESHRQFGEGFALSATTMALAKTAYVASPEQRSHPLASPLRATDFSGLPRTHVMTAEYDMLRDEGAAYAERLDEAGVEVSHTLGQGHVHTSMMLTTALPSARQWRAEVLDVLRSSLP
ncbi:alpha/beta hydrolase [Streptomyces sp. NPDC056656]|uniref:alpha/beta hydrolase n=1 Tax=Streptomyces sp. NPDC056656 TaxID=3345895 RepID=UPI0036AB845D